MTPHELMVLLPCHTLTDFPFYYEGTAADNLLACYTALWHPALLAQARRMPTWRSAYTEAEELAGKLVLLPRACRDDQPGYWLDEAKARGALVVESEGTEPREELVRRALELLGGAPVEIDAATTADFFSLGLCHLMVELLTLQMRYTSLVDEEHFSRQLVAAAEAALEADIATAHDKIAACFDILSEARGHFYPVESYLVDLTLVAPSTLGRSLRRELQGPAPTTLLLSGSVLDAMSRSEPESLAALREALAGERVSIAGGEQEEIDVSLSSPEQLVENFRRGLDTYERLLELRPRVFARRRFGLTPLLPQVLDQFGFSGAVHFTLDDGRFPQARQSIAQWDGTGGGSIPALFRIPLEASRSESILTFPQQMSSAMDMDHVAVVALAHWPGATCPWYEDLRRSAKYAPVVGRFVTLDTLFHEADTAGNHAHFKADEYRSPYLVQQVAANSSRPISKVINLHAQDSQQDAAATISTLATLVRGSPLDPGQNAAALPAALEQFASALPRSKGVPEPGYLVVNPLSFARRVVVDVPALERPPTVAAPVVAAGQIADRRQVVLELPPLGYAWLAADPKAAWTAPSGKRMAEELLLRNEFCEVSISAQTGGIQSIFTPGHRGNRLSQQLALRSPGRSSEPGGRWQSPDDSAQYSTMVAESVEVSLSSSAVGEIVSRGRLLDAASQCVARFRQTTRIERGTPVVWLDVELEPLVELSADPWNHYFAARFAWPGMAMEVFRGLALSAELSTARRLDTPYYVEIREMRTRTSFLTGGAPFHRLVGDSGLDTLLLVRGETERRFRLGIGLDLMYPHTAAQEMLMPPAVLSQTAAAPLHPSSWLLHLDAKNVTATRWEPRIADGRVVGLRVRLVETAGRTVRCVLQTFRPLSGARLVNLLGESLAELQPTTDKVMIDMKAGQWRCLELDFN